MIVVYGYACEAFFGWYSGNGYERFMLINRTWSGPMAWSYWMLLLCNFIVPQLMWSKKFRRHLGVVFLVCMFVNVGMWLERYVIIVVSLSRDFMPSSWGLYTGSPWDWGMYLGTMGLFLSLFFLFIRFLPMISIFEMRTMAPEAKVRESEGH